MKALTSNTPLYGYFLFLLCMLFFVAPLYGAQFEEEVSSQDYLFTQGIIHSITPDEQTITIKQKKGPTISVFIDENTVLEGFYKLTELKRRQKIKVWYQPEKDSNKALKILKPLELGC